MANHRLIIGTEEVREKQKVGHSNSTFFTYRNKKLVIFWGNGTQTFPAEPGMHFMVTCKGVGQPEVKEMKKPSNEKNRILWEAGFYSKKFEATPEEAIARLNGAEGHVIKHDNFVIVLSKTKNIILPLAYWIDIDKVTVSEMMETLDQIKQLEGEFQSLI